MGLEGQLLEIVMIVEILYKRNAALISVIKDLLEQHRRQIDKDDCAERCSFPDKFPEWNRVWRNATKVLFEGGD